MTLSFSGGSSASVTFTQHDHEEHEACLVECPVSSVPMDGVSKDTHSSQVDSASHVISSQAGLQSFRA